MTWRKVRMLRRLACAVHRLVANKLFVAIAVLALLTPQASAQSGLLPRLIFSPWVKLCNKADPEAKRTCVTVKDGRMESGELVVSVAVIEMDGEPRKLLRISLPYGVNLQSGARLIVDQGKPATAPFAACVSPKVPPGGCVADYDATPELIDAMKKGQILTVQAILMNSEAMSPQLELFEFATAFDGPATDPKVFEEQQKKLQNNGLIRDDRLQPNLRPKSN